MNFKYFRFLIICYSLILGIISRAPAQSTFEKEVEFGTNTIGTALLQTPDGGYLVAGSKVGLDTVDLYYEYPCIFKFDQEGNMQWMKSTGKRFPGDIASLAASSDGNYFISGNIYIDSSLKGFLMKFDAQGNTLWSRKIFYSSSICLSPCDDGGCLIAYETQGEMILRIGSDGSVIWADSISSGYTNNYSIIRYDDSNYLVMSGSAFGIAKINLSGTVAWYKIISGPASIFGFSVCKTSDGGFAVCGTVETSPDNTHIYVARFDSSASVLWGKEIDEFSAGNGFSIAQENNGDLVVLCKGSSTGGLIMTINLDGEVRSLKSLGGGNNFRLLTMIRSSDGGFVLTGGVGVTQSHKGGGLILAKLDSLAGGCHLKNELYTVKPVNTWITLPFTTSLGGTIDTSDITFSESFHFNEIDLCNASVAPEFPQLQTISVSPNPINNGRITISLSDVIAGIPYDLDIFDLLGKKVRHETLTFTSNSQTIPYQLTGCAAGTYFLEIRSPLYPNTYFRTKLVKED